VGASLCELSVRKSCLGDVYRHLDRRVGLEFLVQRRAGFPESAPQEDVVGARRADELNDLLRRQALGETGGGADQRFKSYTALCMNFDLRLKVDLKLVMQKERPDGVS
jgi:hypothetical protein